MLHIKGKYQRKETKRVIWLLAGVDIESSFPLLSFIEETLCRL